MIWYHALALLMLLHVTFCFPRGKATEKPEIPLVVNPKQRRPHISEFTDPDTGLNPFLDLEEGRASMGRNVMEDERPDDEPYFDIDLVEGDVPDRKWSFEEEPKEHQGRAPSRWPKPDYKDGIDFPVLTTPSVLQNPPTTVELYITKDLSDVESDIVEDVEEIQQTLEKESFAVSQSTVIYATATVAVTAFIILLVGACWWRKKLKTSRSSSTVESGEVKS